MVRRKESSTLTQNAQALPKMIQTLHHYKTDLPGRLPIEPTRFLEHSSSVS